MEKRVLCVFCGSSEGSSAIYREQAAELGRLLALTPGWGHLVYGGGDLGLMGAVAHGVFENGGSVTGVIPQSLYNVVNKAIGETVVVDTMHERKMRIYQLSSAFLALPGGLGTLDELFEVLTWQQLGIHKKPVAILNIDGFFDPVLAMIASAKEKGFIRVNENRLNVFSSAEQVLPGFEELFKVTVTSNLVWLNTI
jgi:uncharacterized protein (TIGR00730 family)